MDYRKVNKVTRKDAYPLPWIDDTLGALQGSGFIFGVLASKDGLEGHRQNCVCYTSRAIPIYGYALWLVQRSGNV